jgi:PAS domain S-box-containing protein
MQTAVEQSPAAIIITDVNGTISYANKRFSTITGYTLEELLGNNPRLLKSGIHGNDFYKGLWDTVLSKKVWHGELYNKRKDGSYFWEEATIAPILDNKSEIIDLVAIKQDVTSRKEAEAALLESQRQLQELNETKNKLFSIIGHDLRGPIGTLKMLLDVLITDFDQNKPEDIKNMLESVYTSTSVTYDLLENLLMWAKSQQDTVTMVQAGIDIRQAISDSILLLNELAINKGQTLHNQVTEGYLAYADQNMTMTIIRNLIMNAIKFSEPTKHIHIKARMEGAFVEVMVCDEGKGIKPEDIDKLFQPAYSSTGTAGEKGTGLGLLLCKDFVERQGGRLWVESEPGKGSTFSFTLPVFDPVNNPSHKEAGASSE